MVNKLDPRGEIEILFTAGGEAMAVENGLKPGRFWVSGEMHS
jgi:hypothetical protein